MLLNNLIASLNYRLVKKSHIDFPPDLDPIFRPIYNKTKNYSMTSIERMYAMFKATEYIEKNNIMGSIVECGVWKGGSIMIAAYTLNHLRNKTRKLYLYDTFEGMTKPTYLDEGIADNNSALEIWKTTPEWCSASLNEVKNNIKKTKYPSNKLFFVKGKVEDTIPKSIPDKISLLRLDTDWYESTYHELMHLYPRLVIGGVIIIDDYGHWKGCKRAVDNYFKDNKIKILLNRTDYAGRIGIKN